MDCLVTTLKGSISDESLPRLGELGMKYKIPSRTILGITGSLASPGGSVRVPLADSIYISTSNSDTPDKKEISLAGGNRTFYVYNDTAEDADFWIFYKKKELFVSFVPNSSAYAAGMRIYTDGYKLLEPEYCPYINKFISGGSRGLGTAKDLQAFKNILNQVDSIVEEETIDIGYYAFPLVTNLSLISDKIVGDISQLGVCTSLTNLAFGNTRCSGTIESLIQSLRANGKETGSMTGNSSNFSNVTFAGTTANAKGTVTWTATTITMNGITVNA